MRLTVVEVRVFALGALSVLILLNSQSAMAQTSSPTPMAAATPAPQPTPTPAPVSGVPEIRVRKVSGELALYNTIAITVERLSEYLKQTARDPEKFILYLDSRPLKGVNSRLADENTLMFDVKRTSDSKVQWNGLLGRPLWGNKGFMYPVPVTIGYEGDKPIPTDVKAYPLEVVNRIGFWIFVVAFVFSLYIFWWLARHKAIIRDPCPQLPPEQRPYSLGRTQMAFWLFVIAASYVLIWLITSDRDSLTEQALALLGISTATALGAAIVGSSKRSADTSQKQALEQEQSTLENRLNQFDAERSAQPEKLSDLNKEEAEKSARLDQVKKELAQLATRAIPKKSEGFRTDILSDDDGISLHRFQMAIWTIVLGIIFVASVYNSLAMPELSGTLLALMGISGGTYIGFKFPE